MAAAVASECFGPLVLGRIANFRPLVVYSGAASVVAGTDFGFGSDSAEAARGPWSSVVVPQAWIAAAAVGIDAQD